MVAEFLSDLLCCPYTVLSRLLSLTLALLLRTHFIRGLAIHRVPDCKHYGLAGK